MLLLALFLLTLLLCAFGKKDTVGFSKDKTDFLKVFSAVGIILHHLYLAFNLSLLHPFMYWGPIMVGLFFFISGYGLTFSVENKRNYLDGFIKKRVLVTLLPPAIIAFFLFQITRIVFYIQIPKIDIIGLVCRGDYNTILPNSWFVFVILLLYVVFYLSCKFIQPRKFRLAAILLFILLYVFLLKSVGFDGCWYKTILAFWMGMLFYYGEWEKMSLKCFLLFVVSMSVLIMGLVAMKFLPLHIDTSYILFAVFPLLFAVLISRVNVKKVTSSRCFVFLSSISYEMYLTHGIVIFLIKESGILSNDFAIIAWTFFLTMIMATLVNVASKRIQAVAKI